MFTNKKPSVHRNSSAMVINMVTDIKQTCLGQKLGVTFTARKRPSKLMFTMKDLGHTLPGRQIEHLQVTVDVTTSKKSHANHSVKQLSKIAKLVLIYKEPFSKLWFES